MVDLNEMNKRASGLAGRDGRIAVLAENLFKRGLAMTMASARSLAETMVDTEHKVQRQYEERRGNLTHASTAPAQSRPRDVPLTRPGVVSEREPALSIERPAPPSVRSSAASGTPENKYLAENIDAMKRRAVEGVKVEVRAEYETPRSADNRAPKGVYIPPPSKDEYVELKPEMTVAEAVAAAERESRVAERGSEREVSPVSENAEEYVTLTVPDALDAEEEEVARGAGDADVPEVEPAPERVAESVFERGAAPPPPVDSSSPSEGYVMIPLPDERESAFHGADSQESAASLLDDADYVVIEDAEESHDDEPGDEDVSGDASQSVTVAPVEPEAAHDAPEIVDEPLAEVVRQAESDVPSSPDGSAPLEVVDVSSEPSVVNPGPERPVKEDLGKKHGIDLSSIFNVNK